MKQEHAKALIEREEQGAASETSEALSEGLAREQKMQQDINALEETVETLETAKENSKVAASLLKKK